MEIRYLSGEEHIRSRALYEEVFVEDEPAFVDAYYCIKAVDNRILVAEEEGRIVSMLHRNPYSFLLRGHTVQADYLVAVATRVLYRHQGLMRRLLTKALRDMEEEGLPFTFLMPADEAIYTPFDFRLMGNEDEESLAKLDQRQLSEEFDLYVEKDAVYKRRHIPWTEWETTPMMMRIVNLPAFAARVGAREEESLVLAVEDPILSGNNQTFLWSLGTEGSSVTVTKEKPELCISIADLGSFLCGMTGAEELPGIRSGETPDQVIEKLEKIRVLDGIYINEIV